MIQPNNDAIGFCNWMLNISKQYLSGPQKVIVNQVLTAAINQTVISEQTWYNFNLFSAWRNRFYRVYRDYAMQVFPDLLTDLLVSINFEGNADNLVTSTPSVETDVSFNLLFGKVLQGVRSNGTSSNITFTDGLVVNTFSINLWVNPQAGASALGALFGGTSSSSLLLNNISGSLDFVINGMGLVFSQNLNLNVWNMVTIVSDNVNLYFYVNGTLCDTVALVAGTQTYSTLYSGIFGSEIVADLDMFSIWDRNLSQTDIDQLYNGGYGLQYPF